MHHERSSSLRSPCRVLQAAHRRKLFGLLSLRACSGNAHSHFDAATIGLKLNSEPASYESLGRGSCSVSGSPRVHPRTWAETQKEKGPSRFLSTGLNWMDSSGRPSNYLLFHAAQGEKSPYSPAGAAAVFVLPFGLPPFAPLSFRARFCAAVFALPPLAPMRRYHFLTAVGILM